MKKTLYTVAGEFQGKFISKPGFETDWLARQYAALKGWNDYVVRCEGTVEQPTT